MMRRLLIFSALLTGLTFAAPARADDCTRLFGGQSPYDLDSWQGDLWRFAFDKQKGKTDPAALRAAFAKLDADIAAFDPIKPGPLDSVATRITELEGGVLGMQLCDDSLRAATGATALGTDRVSGWNARIQQNAEQFLAIFGEPWEQLVTNQRRGASIRKEVFGSTLLRRAVAVRRPTLLTQVDAAVRATPDGAQDAAALATRQAYATSAKTRAAASAAMPATAGAWRRTGTNAYTRTVGPVTAVLSCSTQFGGGGGLNLALELASGNFISAQRIKDVQATPIWLTINGRERSFAARLPQTGSSTGTGYEYGRKVETTTSYYDGTQVWFSLNAPKLLAQQMRNINNSAMQASTAVTKNLFGIDVPDDENPLKMLMDMTTGVMASALEQNPGWNVDIAEVRTLATLKVAIDSDSFGRINLFDLAPTKPPFKNLMDACWG